MDVVSFGLFSTALAIGGSFILSINVSNKSEKDKRNNQNISKWKTILIVASIAICFIIIVHKFQQKIPGTEIPNKLVIILISITIYLLQNKYH